MATKYVSVVWHHGGVFVGGPKPEYKSSFDPVQSENLDTDHLSIPELEWWVKRLGYTSWIGLYYKGSDDQEFRAMDDTSLVELGNKAKDGDELHFYIEHEISQPDIMEDDGQGGELNPDELLAQMLVGKVSSKPIVLDDDHEDAEKQSERAELADGGEVNLEGENQKYDDDQDEQVNLDDGNQRNDDDQGEEANLDDGNQRNDDDQGEEAYLGDGNQADEISVSEASDEDFSDDSDDTDSLGSLEISDDSEIDEELKEVRQAARDLKAQKKVHKEAQEKGGGDIPLGEVGNDEGYGDWDENGNDYKGKIGGDEPYYGSESDYSMESCDSEEEGQGETKRRRSRHVVYNPNCEVPIWEVSMVFESVDQFREAVAKYAVHRGVKLKLRPNERKRVVVHCKHEGCKWYLRASFDKASQNFMVKTYRPRHDCRRYNTNKLCNSKFLAKKLEDRIISQPGIKLWQIQEICRKDLKMYVGISTCRRAKQKILGKNIRDYREEYAKLHDYVDEINRSNPGSTCFVVVDKEAEPGKETFRRLYTCFNALKIGWKQGCRRIIGIDGCFLKGAVEGQLFVAVGKDGNGQMYPIAWEVTANESTTTWSRFIRALQQDLGLGRGEGLTIVSDMHLGIRAAIQKELPEAEHRLCARHIYANWAKKWNGRDTRKRFWASCWSTFEIQLKDNLEALETLGAGTSEDFLAYGKEAFCKAFFKTEVQCDACENNMCETFNSWILAARHKSIITMLEDIRRQVMTRICKMNAFAKTWICNIAPMALLRLEKNKDLAMQCNIVWNGDRGFEVQEGEYGHTVDLKKNECTCRSWQLKGIPCAHAICAMNHMKINPDDFVTHWHKKPTYLKAYALPIQPVRGIKLWPASSHPPIRKRRGRKKINRRKPRDEPRKFGKMSRKGRVMTCSICNSQGHNKKGCKSKGGSQNTTNAQSSSACPRPATHAQTSSACPRPPTHVQNTQESGNGGTHSEPATATRPAPKRMKKLVGRGNYINPTTGVNIINPGLPSQRVIGALRPTKDASQSATFKLPKKGLKWQGKRAVTRSQLKDAMANPAQVPRSSQTSSNQPQ